MDYDDYQVQESPSWLGGENGSLWSRCLGIVKAAIAHATRTAVKARFADEAGIDTLHQLIEDRNLEPVWNENETSVRARIKAAWRTWALAGTKAGLVKAFELAGYTNFFFIEQPADSTLRWWEFDLLIYPPFPWSPTHREDGRWGDAGAWGDGGAWAADMPEASLSRARVLIRKWKSLHSHCRRLIISHATYGDHTWDAAAPPATWDDDPDATWDADTSYLYV